MSGDWQVSIVTARRPPRPPQTARQRELAALWEQHLGSLVYDEHGDFEDFWEQAARLEAAVVGFGAEHCRFDDGTALADSDLPRFGMQPSRGFLCAGEQDEPESAAGDYMSDETFMRNAGRRLARCSYDHPDGPDLVRVLTSWAQQGVVRVVVKIARTKYGLWKFDLPPRATPDAIKRAVEQELDWAAYSLSGHPGAFLAQEHVPMRYEYRLFVVDHQVVTGAGCVEARTPLDNTASFDGWVQGRRHGEAPVMFRPDVVTRLVKFGRDVVAQFRAERPDVKHYTLDVAIGPAEQPLVIERNGLLNSGLYASDPRLVTKALARMVTA